MHIDPICVKSKLIVMTLLTLAFAGVGSAADNPQAPAKEPPATRRTRPAEAAYVAVPDDPKLPRILILGDSISIGYTIPVRKLLEGKANVHRPADNCGPTTHGVADLDKWLGDGKWDVIHFNFGLHDLKYVDEKNKNTDVSKGKQQVPPEAYEKNLREIVDRLKKTGAKLIWANTTPVPEGSASRVKGDEAKYNEIAAKVMAENNIPTDDLHAVVEKDPTIQLPHNVHFKPEGYKVLAHSVVASIEAALKK